MKSASEITVSFDDEASMLTPEDKDGLLSDALSAIASSIQDLRYSDFGEN